ncbi:DUF397 domain-containing protein [Nocardiopsis sp. CC223A]|uniref:DUF397 domain-containing protein n=1 Tax=Nocardiopsis sp. CC223A TaxID=3044051 RepID=UPI00278BD5AE|nr:DUF397 domain-containing protein [Nocardiopsis sp. CC223A]
MSTEWHKSSYSGASANCVEVRESPERVDVRDTQYQDAGCLTFSSSEWIATLATAK